MLIYRDGAFIKKRCMLAFVFCVLILAACGGGEKEHGTCAWVLFGPGCVMTSGQYAGFYIGMSKSDAFDHACHLSNKKKIWSPYFFLDGQYLHGLKAQINLHTTDFCELKKMADEANVWDFKEEFIIRERHVDIYFGEEKITKISIVPSGLDP